MRTEENIKAKVDELLAAILATAEELNATEKNFYERRIVLVDKINALSNKINALKWALGEEGAHV